jgi:hypothetical protein
VAAMLSGLVVAVTSLRRAGVANVWADRDGRRRNILITATATGQMFVGIGEIIRGAERHFREKDAVCPALRRLASVKDRRPATMPQPG